MNKLSERSVAAFRARLVAWYARNKRAMPWRGTRDAYCVWVSEIMLQQTRVAAVEPYYQRFLRRFPTVRALARARNEEVLKHWAGLGYYSRARNLHRAAREIVAKHDGRFPREVEAALALPGVGRYTAAAVLSIAYGEPLAVVDGNVARVVARLEAVRGELKAAGRWKRLEKRAQELMGAEKTKIEKRSRSFGTKNGKAIEQRKEKFENRNSSTERRERNNRSQRDAGATQPGEWNQAMMELGATVCTPRGPRCGVCPVANWCRARKMGLVEKIPAARTKRETERVEIAAAVFLDGFGYTLLVNPGSADADGYFSRLWQFPAVEVRKNARAELKRHLREIKVASGRQKQNLLEPQMNADKRRYETKRGKDLTQRAQRGAENTEKDGGRHEVVELGAVKHSVTFREITLRPFLVRVRELPAVNGGRAVALEKIAQLPTSSATRKIARAAKERV